MSNYDLLKEIKTVYENINDLLNFKNINLDDNLCNNLNYTKEIMDKLYNEIYESIKNNNEENNLKMKLDCPHCSEKLKISDLIDYDYVCDDCDENFYLSEVDMNFKWYLDNIGDLKLKQDFDIEIGYDSAKNRLIITTEDSSGAKYDCKNILDLKNAISSYISDYLLENLECEDVLE